MLNKNVFKFLINQLAKLSMQTAKREWQTVPHMESCNSECLISK